ncbi:NADH dehydrogenase [ubiquinone] 1 alpha subcomplex assembly factor 2-like [Halichondria panicea]|uniref:NADH dehydrogenase [ubiquinone] 1 alpha subcomplex assembly factor 2-like n=1 Tax=Halichondria panicea TaxID=6063 RepID=UPI00312B8695
MMTITNSHIENVVCVIMSWLKKLLRVGSKVRLVGVDLRGNQYYEQIRALEGGRPKRHVRVHEMQSPEEYSQETVPPEWDRWLRGIADEPPTPEEQELRVQQKQILQYKVENVNRKDSELRNKEVSEGLVAEQHQSISTKAVDHASSPSYKTDANDKPTSTGKEFIPGSWKP